MLLNFQPILGAGTSKSVLRSKRVQGESMKLNMLGNPEMTRFLCLAALKETYEEDDAVLPDAMKIIAEDLHRALTQGIDLPGGRKLRLACTSVKGDWPFLIAAADLNRHFRRAPKAGHTEGGHGICHWCLAGQKNYPLSDCGANPRWARTEGSAAASAPWDSLQPFTALLPAPHGSPENLYRPDIWHNWHLGHGRYFLSSAFIIVRSLWNEESVHDGFAGMTCSWRAFCRLKKVKPPLSKLTKEICGYTAFLDWPEGGWQKGSTTTLLCDACSLISYPCMFFVPRFWLVSASRVQLLRNSLKVL